MAKKKQRKSIDLESKLPRAQLIQGSFKKKKVKIIDEPEGMGTEFVEETDLQLARRQTVKAD